MIILLRSGVVYSDLLSGGLIWRENSTYRLRGRRRIHRRGIDTQCCLTLILLISGTCCR